MIKLNRSECAILHLVLKKKWYDLIASGVKREEYRGCTPHWAARIDPWSLATDKHRVVSFSLGYTKPSMHFLVVPAGEHVQATTITSYSRFPSHGEPCGPHYIIDLAERVELANLKGARHE